MPRSRMSLTIRATSSRVCGPLISSSRLPPRVRRSSSWAARVGTRAPAVVGANQAPASSAPSWAAVRSRTRPLPLVVRSTVSSCRTWGTPSLLGWTSFSIQSAPARRATSSDSRVFSGAAEEAPRWAMTVSGAPGCRRKAPGASAVTLRSSKETWAPLTSRA